MKGIKKFQIKDIEKVLELFKTSFGKDLDSSLWEWRYLNNPYYKDQLIDLMWEHDELVGHYAIWPMQFVYNNRVIKGGMSMTTMTHPNHGGKGIFTMLAKNVYKRALEEFDIEIIWGFPNRNSHYGFISKLDWNDVGIIPMLVSPWLKPDKNRIIEVEEFSLFSDEESKSIEINTPENVLRINKTPSYLNWRYRDHPQFKYHALRTPGLRGFLVVKIIPSFDDKSNKEIDVLEWNVPPDKNQAALALDLIKSFAVKIQIKSVYRINTWMNIHDRRFTSFERLGFDIQKPLTFIGKKELNSNFMYNYLSDWSLTMGDSDVF